MYSNSVQQYAYHQSHISMQQYVGTLQMYFDFERLAGCYIPPSIAKRRQPYCCQPATVGTTKTGNGMHRAPKSNIITRKHCMIVWCDATAKMYNQRWQVGQRILSQTNTSGKHLQLLLCILFWWVMLLLAEKPSLADTLVFTTHHFS